MTYNVEFTDKPDKRGFHHLMIRLHEKGHKPARIQTELEVEARYLSSKLKWGKWVKPSYPFADAENLKIIAAHKRVMTAIGLMLEKESLPPAQAKARYESKTITLVNQYAIEDLINPSLAFSTNQAKVYNWKAFLTWAGEDLAIEHITIDLIEKYVKKHLAEGKKNSTINEYVADIREFYVNIQRLRGIPKREILANSPFLDWKNLKIASQKKGRLHKEGILKLSQAPFDLTRKRRGKRMSSNLPHWARWCWLASHYQAGMRIGDLLRSRYEWYERDSDGYPVRLRYRMQKNGKTISIPLSSQVKAHLRLIWRPEAKDEEYLLPYLDNSASYAVYRTYEQIKSMPAEDAEKLKSRVSSMAAQLNVGLKKVVKELNIKVIGGDTLTNHTSRHSFADKVRLSIKNGKLDAKGRPVTNFDAKDLLGHSFMSTTEMYFGDMDQEMLDSAMEAINEDD